MPSGPRNYGGGGSRGGSGSSFGGGRSSYSRSSMHRGPRRPMRFHFGTRVYVVADKAVSLISLLLFVVICAGIFAFSGFSTMKEHKGYLDTMVADESYYMNLVSTGTKTEATITNENFAFYYNGYDYYQIEYEYRNENGKLCQGASYANYTYSQIQYMNDEIEIAYDSMGVSIPTSYKLRDIEFDYYTSLYKSARNKFIISVAVIVGLIGIGVLIFVKNLKKEEQEKQIAEEKAKVEQEALKPKYCNYCGTKIDPSDKQCGNCGARIE